MKETYGCLASIINHQRKCSLWRKIKEEGQAQCIAGAKRVIGVWFIFALFSLVLICSLLCGSWVFCFGVFVIYFLLHLLSIFRKKNKKGKTKI